MYKIFFQLSQFGTHECAQELYNLNNKRSSLPDFQLKIVSEILKLEKDCNFVIHLGSNSFTGKPFSMKVTLKR